MPAPSPADADAAVAAPTPVRRVRPGRRGVVCLALLGLSLLLGWSHADPQVAASADVPVVLLVHGNGKGTVTLTPPAISFDGAAWDEQTCRGMDSESQGIACRFTYLRGQEVTLQATGLPERTPDPIVFEGWNDDPRCPPGNAPSCTLTLTEDEDFAMATFSPQYIEVTSFGPGTVTVNGVSCRTCGGLR